MPIYTLEEGRILCADGQPQVVLSPAKKDATRHTLDQIDTLAYRLVSLLNCRSGEKKNN